MTRTAGEMGGLMVAGLVALRLLSGVLGAHAEGAALTLVGGGMLAASFARRRAARPEPDAADASGAPGVRP
ncbi:MAG: hypothetical protein RL653_1390 [Pseudomonadota bacterium]|jgi:hypothetical protein